jgi:hypothetical protein
MLSRHTNLDVLLMLFLFSLYQKKKTLVPYDFCWFCRFDVDGNQLFAVSKRVVNAAILLSSSLSLSMVKLTQQLFVETPRKSTKLPSHLINWLSIRDIRRELEKHNKQKVTGNKIEEDMLSLLSKFAPGEIRIALVATLAKMELDIKDLPARKSQLIEVFLQLIFDEMSILANLTKSADRYV